MVDKFKLVKPLAIVAPLAPDGMFLKGITLVGDSVCTIYALVPSSMVCSSPHNRDWPAVSKSVDEPEKQWRTVHWQVVVAHQVVVPTKTDDVSRGIPQPPNVHRGCSGT